MKRWFFLALLSLFLGACSTALHVPDGLPALPLITDFAIEARFALKIERLGESTQSGSGRLSWSHQNGLDQVFLTNPLGAGLAEITISPQISRLRSARGETREHLNPDVLLREVTGYDLPVSRLALWLLGRAGADGRLSQDAFGRPRRLLEAGWQIDYAYADESPTALPFRLDIHRDSEVQLILRIEAWREVP